MPLLVVLLVYLLPGFSLSRIFSGRLRNNIGFHFFLSFLASPVLYTISGYLHRQSIIVFIILLVFFSVALNAVNKLGKISIDTDGIFPETKIGKLLPALIIIFFLMNVLPRMGLILGQYPIGDDMRRLGKTVSISQSEGFPLFYHFPITRMTIYYYVTVGSGLLTKFSGNAIKANLAWFTHVAFWNLSMLYFIALVAVSLFRKKASRIIFFISITFLSGYEFYIALLRGVNPIAAANWTDLEWWTDWFSQTFNIHFQLSSPYTQFFWVPQHMFAGILGLLAFMIIRTDLVRKPVTQIFLGLIFASLLGYSAFVFITIAVSYVLFELFLLLKGRKTLRKFFLTNLLIGLSFFIFSADTLRLFLSSEKAGWFEPRLNVYWFLNNSTVINKIINLILTVPILLTVELGGLFLILLYSLKRLSRGEKEESLLFWHFNIIIPLSVMFFLRAADDNNISLRATIPALIGLAVMAGKLVEEGTIGKLKSRLVYSLLLLSLPTTLYMFTQRLNEQFSFGQQNLDPIYSQIDEKTPLNSIVLTNTENWTNISTLSHRFTFKPLKDFDFTDKEYSAASKVNRFSALKFNNLGEINSFLLEIKKEFPFLNNYHFYFLTDREENLPVIVRSKKFVLYRI